MSWWSAHKGWQPQFICIDWTVWCNFLLCFYCDFNMLMYYTTSKYCVALNIYKLIHVEFSLKPCLCRKFWKNPVRVLGLGRLGDSFILKGRKLLLNSSVSFPMNHWGLSAHWSYLLNLLFYYLKLHWFLLISHLDQIKSLEYVYGDTFWNLMLG